MATDGNNIHHEMKMVPFVVKFELCTAQRFRRAFSPAVLFLVRIWPICIAMEAASGDQAPSVSSSIQLIKCCVCP